MGYKIIMGNFSMDDGKFSSGQFEDKVFDTFEEAYDSITYIEQMFPLAIHGVEEGIGKYIIGANFVTRLFSLAIVASEEEFKTKKMLIALMTLNSTGMQEEFLRVSEEHRAQAES